MVTSFRSRNFRPFLVVKPQNRNGGASVTQFNLTDIFGSAWAHSPVRSRLRSTFALWSNCACPESSSAGWDFRSVPTAARKSLAERNAG